MTRAGAKRIRESLSCFIEDIKERTTKDIVIPRTPKLFVNALDMN